MERQKRPPSFHFFDCNDGGGGARARFFEFRLTSTHTPGSCTCACTHRATLIDRRGGRRSRCESAHTHTHKKKARRPPNALPRRPVSLVPAERGRRPRRLCVRGRRLLPRAGALCRRECARGVRIGPPLALFLNPILSLCLYSFPRPPLSSASASCPPPRPRPPWRPWRPPCGRAARAMPPPLPWRRPWARNSCLRPRP